MYSNANQSLRLRLVQVEIDPDDPYLITPIPDFQPDSEPEEPYVESPELQAWPETA